MKKKYKTQKKKKSLLGPKFTIFGLNIWTRIKIATICEIGDQNPGF
jgi:hypothetical protein